MEGLLGLAFFVFIKENNFFLELYSEDILTFKVGEKKEVRIQFLLLCFTQIWNGLTQHPRFLLLFRRG